MTLSENLQKKIASQVLDMVVNAIKAHSEDHVSANTRVLKELYQRNLIWTNRGDDRKVEKIEFAQEYAVDLLDLLKDYRKVNV
jgi:hypothetical protein